MPRLVLCLVLCATLVCPVNLLADCKHPLDPSAVYCAEGKYWAGTVSGIPSRVERQQGELFLRKDKLEFVFPSGKHPTSLKTCKFSPALTCLYIPYGKMTLLSRARLGTKRVTGIVGNYFAVFGVGAAVAASILKATVTTTRSTVTNTPTGSSTITAEDTRPIVPSILAIGGAATVVGLIFYFRTKRLKTQNYIAVFYSSRSGNNAKMSSSSRATASALLLQSPQSVINQTTTVGASPDLFESAKGSDVAIFRLPNSHDYWNVSMILNSRTGKEFVSETAEKK